jgi:O-antigen biosynthesis protein WbqV
MMPDVSDPLSGVDWDAITGRPPFRIDEAAVRARVEGKTVLVTGAAGSLGRPLAQALAVARPRALVLYDHHESSLFWLRESLAPALPPDALRTVLGDVRDARRVHRLFDQTRPHLVVHLAAYKHVPWGEEDPVAFAGANVLGAESVLDAARASGVEQIVYPSTDKAIDPPSLYGATKRLVEGMLRAAALDGGPRSAVIRFVNVLGSQGSAPEKFARRIRAGEPLPITHPDMRRYWITSDHAKLLLLHAACLSERAVTVVPDAGDEITTMEIARRLFHALRPGQPGPEFVITGLRPGERLSEPLRGPDESLEPAPQPGLCLVRGGDAVPPAQARAAVETLRDLVAGDAAPDAVRAALFDATRPLHSTSR